MTEHEKLKAVCNKIDYKIPEYIWDYNGELVKPQDYGDGGMAIIDVREIIFTTEFIERLTHYRQKMLDEVLSMDDIKRHGMHDMFNNLLDNLDNPADYLYNLIF